MARRILTLDIGAYELTMAEFRLRGAAGVELLRYATHPISPDGSSNDGAMTEIVALGIRDMMKAFGFTPGPLYVSISGQVVFPRFVKLPPVSSDKVAQIVRYEAEQNVPFPIDEVVWDYQLIGTGGGERQVMLVAVKAEIVEDLTNAIEQAGLEPRIVEVAPLALYNVVCHNYPEAEGCTVILDIGARSTNLVFVEPPRVFSRSIPVAGNTISQELMKEFDCSFEEAERLKREQGMVAASGVTGTGDPVADQVAKTVRSIVTRLHAEVNRSVNFYRSQQGGGRPARLLLTGGSSVLPELDTFFREKLGIDVEFLNPVRQVSVAEGISNEEISRDANLLGEVVGLALRAAGECPSEINLMPKALVTRKRFRRRLPFLATAAVATIVGLIVFWAHFERAAGSALAGSVTLGDARNSFTPIVKAMGEAETEIDAAKLRMEELTALSEQRGRLVRLMDALRNSLLDGMWVRTFQPVHDTETGEIIAIYVLGYGFRDRLTVHERGEASAIEVFRNRLAESPEFASDPKRTFIKSEGFSADQDWAKEFELTIGVLNRKESMAKRAALEAME